jgi:hypothetical protein
MGENGRPGASLRAWAEFFPKARLIGCDIDSRVLFTEDRILTYQLDQTNTDSWSNLKSIFSNSGQLFDLIIDDGLHTPSANLKTIIESASLLAPTAYIVIEDVPERSLVVWKLTQILLAENWEIDILKCKYSHLVVLKKKIKN